MISSEIMGRLRGTLFSSIRNRGANEMTQWEVLCFQVVFLVFIITIVAKTEPTFSTSHSLQKSARLTFVIWSHWSCIRLKICVGVWLLNEFHFPHPIYFFQINKYLLEPTRAVQLIALTPSDQTSLLNNFFFLILGWPES